MLPRASTKAILSVLPVVKTGKRKLFQNFVQPYLTSFHRHEDANCPNKHTDGFEGDSNDKCFNCGEPGYVLTSVNQRVVLN